MDFFPKTEHHPWGNTDKKCNGPIARIGIFDVHLGVFYLMRYKLLHDVCEFSASP